MERTLPERRAADSGLARQAALACVLEVSALKAGNITPLAQFADTTYTDMVRSALAIGPVLGAAGAGRVGELILEAVQATSAVVRANTNLGIVLLFAPLARAAATRAPDETLRAAVARVLSELDVADADAAFAAIVLATPGGLGEVADNDVAAPARVGLREAMAQAADRDRIASEYVTGYAVVFEHGLPQLLRDLREGVTTLEAVARLHVALLAEFPDTLIARKAGAAVAAEVSAAAREVLAGTRTAADLDALARDPDHRRNPGTTADLVAATLFAAQLCGVELP